MKRREALARIDPTRIIHSARLVSEGTLIPDSWVAFGGDTVLAAGTGSSWRSLAADGAPVTDAAGRHLTPGFVDIHCHGGNGVSFDEGGAHIQTALHLHRAHGTTRSVLSLVTASLPLLEQRLADAVAAMDDDALIIGVHLEGPFLNERFRGAHDPSFLRVPDAGAIDRLLDAGRGRLRQVTLAPELPGAGTALTRFRDAGVAVAVGHSAADFDTALSAFRAGASILTHAFNAMPGLHHRDPGPVAAALSSPGVILEIINDGVHLHPEVVRLAFDAAPGRIALVTDAMAAAGAPDGSYRLGTLDVTVRDRVARLTAGGAIAGSTLTLDVALRRTVTESGVPLVEAVRAITQTPARAIGRGSDLGSLSPGFAADAVILSDSLHVDLVFAAGIRVA